MLISPAGQRRCFFAWQADHAGGEEIAVYEIDAIPPFGRDSFAYAYDVVITTLMQAGHFQRARCIADDLVEPDTARHAAGSHSFYEFYVFKNVRPISVKDIGIVSPAALGEIPGVKVLRQGFDGLVIARGQHGRHLEHKSGLSTGREEDAETY